MNELRAWIEDPQLRSMLVDMVSAGVAAALVCSVLSVLVVLKRLSFVGQGVSHSAFGGLGLAALVGLAGSAASGAGLFVVGGFCVLAAVAMGLVSDRRTMTLDAAIGATLAATMAAGFVMLDLARRGVGLFGAGEGATPPSAESLLFGQIAGVGGTDAGAAWIMAAAVLGVLWWFRRPIVFWAFDETAAPAFGVRGTACKLGVLAMLAVAIVVSMRLVGVVLVTALLVLPGAAALKLSDRFRVVLACSVATGVIGVVVGIAGSLALNIQAGPSIVLALVALFALAGVVGRVGAGALGRGGRTPTTRGAGA